MLLFLFTFLGYDILIEVNKKVYIKNYLDCNIYEPDEYLVIDVSKDFALIKHCNLDFYRKSYTEDSLKPQDILTIMFSFKNVGSYKSSNLAVSENDKQDIRWESESVKNDLFN